MSTVYDAHAREIVDQVRSWPADARRDLAQGILSTLPEQTNGRRRNALKELLGLMKSGDNPPNDAESQAILEDELIRKHVR